jgi:hypothetical protein
MKFWRIFQRKKPFEQEVDRIYRERLGDLRVEHGEGFDLVRFDGDYETYRTVQTIANKAKLDWRAVKRDNIAYLCKALTASGVNLRSILCHGTRNAAEQKFFQESLPNATILGTEISETATQFPMTIQWDFHEVKPEWRGAFDIVFSNSWDHSYDPHTLFPAWLSCVAPNGALVLEWSTIYEKTEADAVDPFRATLEGLLGILKQHISGTDFAAPIVLRDPPVSPKGECFVVVRRPA